MPELPEVEFCRTSLARWSAGRRVVAVELRDPRVVRASRTDRPSAGRPDGELALRVATAGACGPLQRHGKRLLWTFGPPEGPPTGALLLHLGMTGKWTRERPGEPAPPHLKARLLLDDGSALSFVDPRLLGGIVPLSPEEGRACLREGLGPDALAQPLPELRGERPVKVALMDQAVVAGLGNVQVMESLWRAGIDPRAPCTKLTQSDLRALDEAIQETLRWTLETLGEGDHITYVEERRDSNPFLIYRREGSLCPRCGAPITRFVQGGRSTYACLACQVRGR